MLLQGWVVYFPFVLGPAFLAIGGLFIIWESSGKLHRGESPASCSKTLSQMILSSAVFASSHGGWLTGAAHYEGLYYFQKCFAGTLVLSKFIMLQDHLALMWCGPHI